MGVYRKFILPRLLNSVMGSKEVEKLRPGVISGASGVVLEIGPGSGYNFPFYQGVSKLYALEPSRELTEIAKERAGSTEFPIEFINARAEKIPLADSSVDTVVSTWTLCSIDRPDVALSEMRRVLKTSGYFVFIDHGISPQPLVRFMQGLLTPFTKYFTGNCHLNRDIEKLLRDSGFAVENLQQFHERFHPLVYNNKGVARPRLR